MGSFNGLISPSLELPLPEPAPALFLVSVITDDPERRSARRQGVCLPFRAGRDRSPVVTGSGSRGSRTVADAAERHAPLLESVLGATLQEFESPILRHADLHKHR